LIKCGMRAPALCHRAPPRAVIMLGEKQDAPWSCMPAVSRAHARQTSTIQKEGEGGSKRWQQVVRSCRRPAEDPAHQITTNKVMNSLRSARQPVRHGKGAGATPAGAGVTKRVNGVEGTVCDVAVRRQYQPEGG